MNYRVLLTQDALWDLESIDDYICLNDSPAKADRVIGSIQRRFSSLAENPERGSFPEELLELGIKDYREVYFKPYRIIYTVIGTDLVVLLIADGRRDMESLLTTRILNA